MAWTVGEVSAKLGVSVRALRYYDEIGLLPPSGATQAGYRLYDERALEVLAQILYYRDLELPLEKIRGLLGAGEAEREKTLNEHRQLLLLKRRRIDALVELIEQSMKGEMIVKDKLNQATNEYERQKEQYGEEVKSRWGNTQAYAQSVERQKKRTPEQEKALMADAEAIFQAFADLRAFPPDDARALALVRRWQNHITRYYYDCTDQMLSCLGQMYVADERFTRNIDRAGEGTAAYMSKAIECALR